jgi:hypothetical protein
MIEINNVSYLCCSIYMPCDDNTNIEVYESVLHDVTTIALEHSADHLIIGGDLNTDLSRSHSLHTMSLKLFVSNEDLVIIDDSLGIPYNVDFTFESTTNASRSILDHFIVSHNIVPHVMSIECNHDVNNSSDHVPLTIELNVNTKYVKAESTGTRPKPQWHKATNEDLDAYRSTLDVLLQNIVIPEAALECSSSQCTNEMHREELLKLHDSLIQASLRASEHAIPSSSTDLAKGRPTVIPGWNEYVAPLKSTASLWHFIWKECGRPQNGIVADIRRRTRAQYHRMIRQVKRNEATIRSAKMAEAFHDTRNHRRDFWSEVKKVKGGSGATPATVDGVHGADSIANTFCEKYADLFNSIQTTDEEMSCISDVLSSKVHNHEQADECSGHFISFEDVRTKCAELKSNKHDG